MLQGMQILSKIAVFAVSIALLEAFYANSRIHTYTKKAGLQSCCSAL